MPLICGLNKKLKKDKSDEYYTPSYTVKPILKYLKPNSTIWCPFDTENSEYVKILKENGHNVIFSHIWNNKDFFKHEEWLHKDLLNQVDYIISNPPFSCKTDVLIELYKIGKPFMMLLPIDTLETNIRQTLYKNNGLELLIFDKRTNFPEMGTACTFLSIYYCWKILDKNMIFEELDKPNGRKIKTKI